MAVAPRMERISLSRAPEDLTHLPNLIEIQTRSYTDFLQWEVPPHERQGKGLQAVFNEYFPIESPNGLIKLEYVSYNLIPPRYTIEECQNLGLTYSGTLKALLRLTLYEESLKEERVEKQVLEQEVFIAEVPLMTPTGTFIINGAERVIVSQLHKSPGVSFERKQHPGGKYLLSSRIIPYRGAWIEFEYDTNDVLWVTVDRRIRMLATTLLKALGYVDSEEILKMFYRVDRVQIKRTKAFIYQKQKIKRGEKEIEKEVESKIEVRDLVGYWLANDIIDPETGEVIAD
ncbi:MAG TPA: DNA-directed RNA polymerase subunit beta, partial [Candidatus Hydrogenedens sp.]|nr:DNA-directed RNA polymerase subunit beta [Candidatus Hydrogenedens sp.]